MNRAQPNIIIDLLRSMPMAFGRVALDHIPDTITILTFSTAVSIATDNRDIALAAGYIVMLVFYLRILDKQVTPDSNFFSEPTAHYFRKYEKTAMTIIAVTTTPIIIFFYMIISFFV